MRREIQFLIGLNLLLGTIFILVGTWFGLLQYGVALYIWICSRWSDRRQEPERKVLEALYQFHYDRMKEDEE